MNTLEYMWKNFGLREADLADKSMTWIRMIDYVASGRQDAEKAAMDSSKVPMSMKTNLAVPKGGRVKTNTLFSASQGIVNGREES